MVCVFYSAMQPGYSRLLLESRVILEEGVREREGCRGGGWRSRGRKWRSFYIDLASPASCARHDGSAIRVSLSDWPLAPPPTRGQAER